MHLRREHTVAQEEEEQLADTSYKTAKLSLHPANAHSTASLNTAISHTCP